MSSTHFRSRPAPFITAACAAASLFVGLGATSAAAEPNPTPSVPPGSVTAPEAPKVDANSPGLKLTDGGTLAPARVIDIKSVVEDTGGEESRSETPSDVKFALQAEVLFPKDSDKLNAAAASRIKAIGQEAVANKSTKIRVFGFTDNLGSYEHGQKLSKKRADMVQLELTKTLGSNVTFEVRGYSEDYPIADNATEEGRKKNRRVEVTFPRGDAPNAGTKPGA
ncbi:OmpA family protein [Streptomyces sp. NPDC048442]|uniref:OmpA family protein n=1 Tax=Streptomyces sp. NPDC048442 TaxID=3154823 RepID=UPI003420A742